MKLYLIRGVSGSGKTTLAHELKELYERTGMEVTCTAADDYFYDQEGNYNWDAKFLREAHRQCQRRVRDGLAAGDVVIVHNTFTTQRDLKPYLEMADFFDYPVVSLVVENRHGNDSVHDVPRETRENQRKLLHNNLKL